MVNHHSSPPFRRIFFVFVFFFQASHANTSHVYILAELFILKNGRHRIFLLPIYIHLR